MATPFDGRTWTLRYEGLFGSEGYGHGHSHSHSGKFATPLVSPFEPLQPHAKFCVDISDKEVAVRFDKDTPPGIRNIWENACDVYYDKEFMTIRGDLHYNPLTGESGTSLSHHFVITYRGRLGVGGTKRQVHVMLLDAQSAFSPTADLVRTTLGFTAVLMSHRGSWKADD